VVPPDFVPLECINQLQSLLILWEMGVSKTIYPQTPCLDGKPDRTLLDLIFSLQIKP
jgi:hypothetical protein